MQEEVIQAKTQIESIVSHKADFLVKQLKYVQFHYNNKSSKLSPNLLQHKEEKQLCHQFKIKLL